MISSRKWDLGIVFEKIQLGVVGIPAQLTFVSPTNPEKGTTVVSIMLKDKESIARYANLEIALRRKAEEIGFTIKTNFLRFVVSRGLTCPVVRVNLTKDPNSYTNNEDYSTEELHELSEGSLVMLMCNPVVWSNDQRECGVTIYANDVHCSGKSSKRDIGWARNPRQVSWI